MKLLHFICCKCYSDPTENGYCNVLAYIEHVEKGCSIMQSMFMSYLPNNNKMRLNNTHRMYMKCISYQTCNLSHQNSSCLEMMPRDFKDKMVKKWKKIMHLMFVNSSNEPISLKTAEESI